MGRPGWPTPSSRCVEHFIIKDHTRVSVVPLILSKEMAGKLRQTGESCYNRSIFYICIKPTHRAEDLFSRMTRLMLLITEDVGVQIEPVFATIEGRVYELYNRPYIDRGMAERTLILLGALLEVRARIQERIAVPD